MTETAVALVTGAAKRIGAVIARTLHQSGYRVIIHYGQSTDEANALASALNSERANSAVTLQADLCDMNDVARLAREAQQQWGQVDVLVNNASAFFPTPLGEITDLQWQALVGSNVQGPLFLSQALTPALRERQGNIINLVDMHIHRPLLAHSIYCLAKSALASLTRSLATELAPAVRVNGVGPGAILWPEREMTDTERDALLSSIPLQRLGTPEDIAQAISFLLNAPYITGQILYVDGGRSVHTHATA
ncbi:pteridine reductase [Alteromonas sp. ASW11-19]|uniref:Pteridine reductase n=1 Tax=Alteromonas salexigens TaxID=2982530 RepID=A0ABT2VKQ7_9ALTE|nr:pteridine reductase [Alteromonas salexigens]MCU7553882.1 pteridine reductase [Alteromonas salexigens]